MTYTDYPYPPEIADFARDIAAHMVLLFDIPLDEARGRINRHWHGVTFEAKDDIVLHETEEFWAKEIYYESGAMWWLGEEGLDPRPYP